MGNVAHTRANRNIHFQRQCIQFTDQQCKSLNTSRLILVMNYIYVLAWELNLQKRLHERALNCVNALTNCFNIYDYGCLCFISLELRIQNNFSCKAGSSILEISRH